MGELSAALDGLRALIEGETREPIPSCDRLDALADTFDLSSFERSLLLLAAAPDVDGSFARLLPDGKVTFGFALEKLPEPHWDALSTDSNLRRWELIRITAAGSLTHSPIRIDETVLMALLGVKATDEQLLALVEHVHFPDALAPSHLALAKAVAGSWRKGLAVNLVGPDAEVKREIFGHAARDLGLEAWSIQVSSFPPDAAGIFEIGRKWTRQAALHGAALLIEAADDGAHASRFSRGLRTPCVVSSVDRAPNFTGISLDVGPLERRESAQIWTSALGERAMHLNGVLDALVEQFSVPMSEIPGLVSLAEQAEGPFSQALWQAAREASRRRLDDLALRLQSQVSWEDIVLPEETTAVLKEVVANVRNRSKVLGEWGFGDRISRGLGVAALFHGPSGTGKTLAADVLANELGLDLFRIDLASIVSKYIGETEKNLRRIFDAAERCGAVLLFDEADALFGKRTEVKDSHDRYANIEVGYLLQRMESYRGIAILTTNMKEAFDPAFLRRIRFVVQFPFPGEGEREKIWRRCIPSKAPLKGVALDRLAKLSVPGGNIRNISLSAAYLASEEGCAIQMRHFLAATRSEYSKIERPLTDSEVAGWV
jgi:hypothetical protein